MESNHYTCGNCELAYCFDYANDNKICSGLVKNKNQDVPYDVIRLCINTTSDEEPIISDLTPDEVSSIITALSHSLGEWMTNTESYNRFRDNIGGEPPCQKS